ncbi:hypothetical protein WM40_14310 [Robbsia andropogonis]|uniref:Uncharacterized protein n=1 Tax=Robbsia andropogonis TaxID=28092 RepID=A0A0F5JYN3_9BURK|nr:hypothetical protein WM40_14310 [Robbsia andropogonis]
MQDAEKRFFHAIPVARRLPVASNEKIRSLTRCLTGSGRLFRQMQKLLLYQGFYPFLIQRRLQFAFQILRREPWISNKKLQKQ